MSNVIHLGKVRMARDRDLGLDATNKEIKAMNLTPDDTLTICTAYAYAIAALERLPTDWKADGETVCAYAIAAGEFENDIRAMLEKLAPDREFAEKWIADAKTTLDGLDKPRRLHLV